MGFWIFGKKKIDGLKKEILVLEKKEEKIEREEIKLIKAAIVKFEHLRYNVFGLYHDPKGLYFEHPNEFVVVRKRCNEVQEYLLDIRVYGKRMVSLAQKIEKDLLMMRGVGIEERKTHLSDDELMVINFAKEINNIIDLAVSNIKDFIKLKAWDSINHACKPSNVSDSEKIYNEYKRIVLALEGISARMIKLWELQKKVEQLILKSNN